MDAIESEQLLVRLYLICASGIVFFCLVFGVVNGDTIRQRLAVTGVKSEIFIIQIFF